MVDTSIANNAKANLVQKFGPGGQLTIGKGFNGTEHSEILIVYKARLALSQNPGGVDVDSLALLATVDNVVGISKRCCPVCEHLLCDIPLPAINKMEPFIIKGSHTTITPCALPASLPLPALENMVTFFGTQLRRVLGDLAISNAVVRARSLSTGTQRFSPTTKWAGGLSIHRTTCEYGTALSGHRVVANAIELL